MKTRKMIMTNMPPRHQAGANTPRPASSIDGAASIPIVTTPSSERFLSEATCAALAKRIQRFAEGGGESRLSIDTTMVGNIRYSRNQIRSSGEVRNNIVDVTRNVRGAPGTARGNQIDDLNLLSLVRRAEQLCMYSGESGDIRFQDHQPVAAQLRRTGGVEVLRENAQLAAGNTSTMVLANVQEPYDQPKLFFDSTYAFDAAHRADAIEPLVGGARAAGMLAAGYIEATAAGTALMDTWGHHLYYPYTVASFTVTVRSPQGDGSGWAGINWNDWDRVDAKTLSEVALDKCVRSRNPTRIEPGRYTVILEPQAVHDLFWPINSVLDRLLAEGTPNDPSSTGEGVFARGKKTARFGERVLDERITLSQDPMDPDCGSLPFDEYGNVYHAATWIKNGVLVALPYFRNYAIQVLGKNTGLPNSYAYRMSGGRATLDDMVRSTRRGIYVTRFSNVALLDAQSLLCTGYTRDGTWLVENGTISKSIKNMKFTESPMFAFNKVEMLGIPQRVYSLPICPAAVVPPAKVNDFSFTSLTDAI